jgi:uncharacterized protein (TIGR03663 family)
MTKKCCVLILVATIAALALRLPRLNQRPMHGDEAVHAIKFGELLEKGKYTYNPVEYHGPTLNYLTLIPAWLTSADTLVKVNEFTLRIVPVCCGILLILLIFLVADGLGEKASVFAAILTAVSPAMVFYSRYYIQEMLLVCFTFGVIASGYRYYRGRKIFWVISAGVFLGLMHATKETFIISLGSMLLALVAVKIFQKKIDADTENVKKIKVTHILVGLIVAAIVSVLFFSSFLTNPKGIVDSVLTYKTYFERADGNIIHNHPWYYYLRILTFGKGGSEALIILLAAYGFISSFHKKWIISGDVIFLKFISFYTLFLTVIYSVIPYKTPWCALGFLHGMILLAGFGAAVMFQNARKYAALIKVSLLLLTIALGCYCYSINYKDYADSRNPYVYAHPTTEIFDLVNKVDFYANASPEGKHMYIEVICPEHDYWPLPWYLRSYTSVAWRTEVAFKEPSASLIIASDSVEPDLQKKIFDDSIPFEQRQMYMYMIEKDPYYIYLRPKVKLYGYVRKDLWDTANRAPDPDELINKQAEK